MKVNWTTTYEALTVWSIISLFSTFFVPTMKASANSLGCRFQDVRLQAVMFHQPQSIWCVLHWSEVILLICVFLVQVYRMLDKIIDLPATDRLRFLALGGVLIPFIDLTLLGLKQVPIQYGLIYQFYTGYWLLLLTTLFIAGTVIIESIILKNSDWTF